MVLRTRVELVDDLDPEVPAEATVAFTLDGEGYEIDLGRASREQLDRALAPFLRAARAPGAPRRPRTPPAPHRPAPVVTFQEPG